MPNNNEILRKLFALKYLELTKVFPDIHDLKNREFAFFAFDKNYMMRHKGYHNKPSLIGDLKRINPKHAYLSAAIYNDPANKKMDDKEWLGCDFVVDIDSDHMELPCSHEHDYHFCNNCSYYNKGKSPEKCPECGENKFTKQLWLCDDCLNVSKEEVFKLVNFFENDFGFEQNDIDLKFSGHRGYHLTLSDDKIRKLSSDDRRHIVDYLSGIGFNPYGILKLDSSTHSFMGTNIDDIGWRGKIANQFLKILDFPDYESFDSEFHRFNLDKSIIDRIFNEGNKKYLRNQLKNRKLNWTIQDMGSIRWKKFIQFLIDTIKCEVDVPVSIDIHRLIRLEGSIHGKTGFLVRNIKFNDLKDFDAFYDPIIFSFSEEKLIPVRINTEHCPPIRIKDNIYGPYIKDEKIKLPEAVAIFLASKNVALIEKK
ncbi:MAG: hypothetical protein GY870_01250 [archaeon]|nr:hypothetical protein [archaeon]